MFNFTKPCKSCPFHKTSPEAVRGLERERIEAIVSEDQPAFQCHETVDYDNFEDERLRQGEKPEQCAGLTALHKKLGTKQTTIIQVAERLGYIDLDQIETDNVFDSVEEMVEAHGKFMTFASRCR